MITTELKRSQQASTVRSASNDVRRDASPPPSERSTFGGMVGQVLPLLGVVCVAGPPGLVVAGGTHLLALMLIGPFTLLLMPYRVVRHLHTYAARHGVRGARIANDAEARPVRLKSSRAVA